MRILVADDHTVVRKGIKQIISEAFSNVSIIEACDGRELMQIIRDQSPDLIVSDLVMPGKGTLEIIKDLKLMGIKTPFIVLSMHPAEQYAIRVLKAGASGYLTKESAPEELVKAIHLALAGKKYINEQISYLLLSQMGEDYDLPLHEKLSDREFTVFRMLADGKSISDIAEELHLSIATISTYKTRILDKTGLKSIAELAKYAIQNQLT